MHVTNHIQTTESIPETTTLWRVGSLFLFPVTTGEWDGVKIIFSVLPTCRIGTRRVTVVFRCKEGGEIQLKASCRLLSLCGN